MINNATPRFHAMFVLRNRISKTAYYFRDASRLYNTDLSKENIDQIHFTPIKVGEVFISK